MGFVQVKNIKQVIDYHVQNKIPHKMIQTANTNKLISKLGNYIGFENHLKKKDLILINKVKNYILKNNIVVPKNVREIKYITPFMPQLDLTREIYAIDITAAYWYASKNLNFISEDLFNEGLKKVYTKKGRLISIGALASQPITSEFNGVSYTRIKAEPLPTANIFYKCAEQINDLMQGCAMVLDKDFIFYWVDCVFFYGSNNVKKVENVFKSMDFECKPEKIISISQDFNKKIITLVTDKKTSNFYFKKQ